MKPWRQRFFDKSKPEHQVYIVCGGRRTGTTLLAAILSSDQRANKLEQEAQLLTRMIESFKWGRENFDNFGRAFFGELNLYREFNRETIYRFIESIINRISPGGVLILKNPELSLVFNDVIELIPTANLFVTVRDPRDQISSEFEVGSRRVALGTPDVYFESRDVISLAHNYNAYYKEILKVLRENSRSVNLVRYEDLVINTEEKLAELRKVSRLEVDFDPTKQWPSLSVSALQDLKCIPANSRLYGGPVERSSVGRFRRDLKSDEIKSIEKICQEIMEEFNY